MLELGRAKATARGFQGSREHPSGRDLFPSGQEAGGWFARLPASPPSLPTLTPQLSTLSGEEVRGWSDQTGPFIVRATAQEIPSSSELSSSTIFRQRDPGPWTLWPKGLQSCVYEPGWLCQEEAEKPEFTREGERKVKESGQRQEPGDKVKASQTKLMA